MAENSLVRTSCAGDQFHYLWAARRCLRLLDPQTGVVAITIEGASPEERSGGPKIPAGEELIDIAEYCGSEEIEHATAVKYMQLKHSTLHVLKPWTASGLAKTLKGFAARFQTIQSLGGNKALCHPLIPTPNADTSAYARGVYPPR